jgi:hypothetical protein
MQNFVLRPSCENQKEKVGITAPVVENQSSDARAGVRQELFPARFQA